jgi:hypothetical protein
MTTTLLHNGTTRTPTTDVLRLLLDDVLAVVGADDDGDRYSSRTAAGRALVSLTTLARQAAGALCVGQGIALTGGPGVVVQRELAAAARLLDAAAEATDGESWEIPNLLVRAERLRVQLEEALATTRR